MRTVAVKPVRGPLIRSAFELYASGAYTVRTLIQALTDAGLRTKPTYRYPDGTVLSIHALGKLSDRYYLGVVEYRAEEYPGRHEPLVTAEIFDRVQQVMESRRTGGGRAGRSCTRPSNVGCVTPESRKVISPRWIHSEELVATLAANELGAVQTTVNDM